MSAPADKKTEEKKKGLSTKAKLWIIGVSLLVVPLLIWLCTEPSPKNRLTKMPTSVSHPELIMRTDIWVGLAKKPGTRLNAWPIRDDVDYKIRLDKDPSTTRTLTSREGPGEALIDVGPSRYVEFQLCENQVVAECEILYEMPNR